MPAPPRSNLYIGLLCIALAVLLIAVDAEFPARRAAHVSITTKDGRQLTHYQPTRKGDPDLPLSNDELDAKFIELTSPVLGSELTNSLLQNLWQLDDISLATALDFAVLKGDR